ncbi:MAG: hypothetical protein L0Y57_00560, partial [Beijerinckiaceae bacterium]|nr:hypothetical protein [Beijerinckiaceae bacterium]
GSLVGAAYAAVREILRRLRTTDCRPIGAEYMHITATNQKRWLQQRLELDCAMPGFDPPRKRRILERLVAAATLEEYLHRKYVGQKRFSLEGGESAIPLLDELVQSGGKSGIKEVVIGMAHRGRINVLVNIVGKHPAELFDEFEGKGRNGGGSGDVKYHLGYSSDIGTPGGPVHLTLAFNPSHLEIINPVVKVNLHFRDEAGELCADFHIDQRLYGSGRRNGPLDRTGNGGPCFVSGRARRIAPSPNLPAREEDGARSRKGQSGERPRAQEFGAALELPGIRFRRGQHRARSRGEAMLRDYINHGQRKKQPWASNLMTRARTSP